jgi:hypothetical protein
MGYSSFAIVGIPCPAEMQRTWAAHIHKTHSVVSVVSDSGARVGVEHGELEDVQSAGIYDAHMLAICGRVGVRHR